MKRQASKITYTVAAIFAVVVFIISLVGSGGGIALAATSRGGYTDVLADLKKDESFNAADYPDVKNDYSLKVIQIAESENKELFVYVYQPAAKTKPLTATSINMAAPTSEKERKLYSLTLLNRNGVFAKYLVDGYEVTYPYTLNEQASRIVGQYTVWKYRYYDIASIYRAWDKDIDEGTGNDNTKDEVAYPVGQLWTVKTNPENGAVIYSMKKTDVVTVIDKYVDFLRYLDGFKIGNWSLDSCDSHYIAFSCDYSIDELYSADVYYSSQSFYHPSSGSDQYGELESKQITLKYTDTASNPADGIGGIKYTWDRIEKTSDFIKRESLSTEAETQIKDKQWVLRFCETAYSKSVLPGSYNTVYTESKTLVTSVSIFRLHFKSNGKVYNLGVVDNKQSGDDKPGNIPYPDEDEMTFWEWLYNELFVKRTWWVWLITVAIFLTVVSCLIKLLSLFVPIFVPVWNGLWKGIKWLFIGLWLVISAPFRFIAWVVKKIKGDD